MSLYFPTVLGRNLDSMSSIPVNGAKYPPHAQFGTFGPSTSRMHGSVLDAAAAVTDWL